MESIVQVLYLAVEDLEQSSVHIHHSEASAVRMCLWWSLCTFHLIARQTRLTKAVPVFACCDELPLLVRERDTHTHRQRERQRQIGRERQINRERQRRGRERERQRQRGGDTEKKRERGRERER